MKNRIETLNLKALKKQEINARFMTGVQFRQLVDNIRRDGALTSVPLVLEESEDTFKILSGHHRVAAAIEAGIIEAPCMIVEEQLTRDQEVALVLSHNSLSGQDDPATLLQLYSEIESPDWRMFSGLDDRTLELLDKVDTESLSEANLDFSTVQLVFLPHEKEAAEECVDEARRMSAGIDQTWLAPWRDYDRMLDALETVQESYTIGNVATAFAVILGVFENHLDELHDGWCHDDFTPKKDNKDVPMETVFGSRTVKAHLAATILQAAKIANKNGDMPSDDPWDFVAFLADAYAKEAQTSLD